MHLQRANISMTVLIFGLKQQDIANQKAEK